MSINFCERQKKKKKPEQQKPKQNPKKSKIKKNPKNQNQDKKTFEMSI